MDDFVKLQLGFGERDFAVNSEAGLLYDPDETDNLGKLLSELGKRPGMESKTSLVNDILGIDQNSFVTIVDEEEDEPFINVVLNIQSLYSYRTPPFNSLFLLTLFLDPSRAQGSPSRVSSLIKRQKSRANPRRSPRSRRMALTISSGHMALARHRRKT